MIKPLNHHYALENPPSVYDEEAMTALELAGRTTAKVNEVVNDQNKLREEVTQGMSNQDKKVQEGVASIPQAVTKEVQRQINNGTFQDQIIQYAGGLDDKIDKGGTAQVTMQNLTNEVKTAMTGGSVAVVGDNSVYNQAIQTGAVSADKLAFVSDFGNLLFADRFHANQYWPSPDATAPVNGCVTYDPIRLKAGVTYYYAGLYGGFCHLVFDGSNRLLDDNVGDDSSCGVLTPEADCWFKITGKRPGRAILTTNPIPQLTLNNENQFLNNVRLKEEFMFGDIMEGLAIGDVIRGTTWEGFGGGYVENMTIVIPAGYQGTNTYVSMTLDTSKAPLKPGQELVYFLNMTLTNPQSENDFSVYLQDGGRGDIIGTRCTRKEPDGSLTYICHARIPTDAICENIRVSIQMFPGDVYGSDFSLRLNDLKIYTPDNFTALARNAFAVDEGKAVTTEVTVALDGSGQYSSLRTCLQSINPSALNHYRVLIGPGVYELRNDYTEAEWNNEDFIGLMVPDYCTLVGVDRDNCIIQATRTDGHQKHSTLNLSNTSGLENLTVKGTKTRYAVHDDFASNNHTEYKRTVKNCVFEGVDLYYNVAYGSGCQQGANWVFEDCVFNSNTGYGFSNHNNENWKRPASIKFKNCRFSGGSYGLRLGSLNINPKPTYVTFDGCRANGVLIFEENADRYGHGCQYLVSGYANSLATVTVEGATYNDIVDLI